MAQVGRPRIEINWDEFDKLCMMWCTLEEIAAWFKCSSDTIERRVQEEHNVNFAEYHKQKAALGNISLRRKQLQLAMDGDKTMLIFLGKNKLGQTDRHEMGIDGQTSKIMSIDNIIHRIAEQKKRIDNEVEVIEIESDGQG